MSTSMEGILIKFSTSNDYNYDENLYPRAPPSLGNTVGKWVGLHGAWWWIMTCGFLCTMHPPKAVQLLTIFSKILTSSNLFIVLFCFCFYFHPITIQYNGLDYSMLTNDDYDYSVVSELYSRWASKELRASTLSDCNCNPIFYAGNII